ncbi:LPS export ABC transporter permease LptG [Nitrosomonas ureae]|uniref:Lipopolysaccharide export system permease protein n=1 Tax=Nitrosomonas ureae TaxID=44577 RepID=A0A1H9CEW2_9PROT|nr:LPS export ABC transporter permease LptG [Nitrosomonas ureae]PTQ87630.1 lipopolysaccharide export system permease protein [Nitrosomonas ureae]SEP99735.1 lipopolysaccharide export system permease protein [Nitrosomonas ureae]SOD16262.1 lipopolysaccharide export system permease protein [Nitrosomonas ureae]
MIYLYISRQVLIGFLIAIAVILPLFSFFDLLDQLDDVGRGTYRITDAFLYTTMLLPRRFIQIAPFVALLGTVTALGKLAIHSELIAMRVAGLSPWRISLAPLSIGILLLLGVAILEQFIAPQLQQKAITYRAIALEQSAELGRNLGIWTRNEKNILRIGQIINNNKAATIEILQLDQEGFLAAHVLAQTAEIVDNETWELSNVIVRTFADNQITVAHHNTLNWSSFVSPEDIATLTKPPESLSPLELFRHVEFLRSTGQEADSYALALWRKIGSALMTIAMLLLSIPFVFGSIRSGLSNKLVFASLIGIAVYLLDQIIANTGLILQLNPALIALAPGFTIIMVANVWLRRTH